MGTTTRKIVIDPVTKVEGHGKVTIHLDEKGDVSNAHFHVVEFRGFEKFCEGRLASEMPMLTARICGICPVSHHLASVKALDAAFGVTIPPAAKKLRELLHFGQMIHSHALHFYYLSAPDFLLGSDSDPSLRGITGIAQKFPDIAKKAIHLRKIGQDIVDMVGGRAIHPVSAIPGGMSKALSHKERFEISKSLKDAMELARMGLDVIKDLNVKFDQLYKNLGYIETGYLALDNNGALELYDGKLKLIDKNGAILENIPDIEYQSIISERVEDYSYLKSGYYKKQSFADGVYRVGPLARLNVCERIDTPEANKEFADYREMGHGGKVHTTAFFHYARMIEILHSVEKAIELIHDDDVVSSEHRVTCNRKSGEGVGIIEAPRGTLIHHYTIDDFGKIEKANFIVATTNNNAAMDLSTAAAARAFIKGGNVNDALLNNIEMAVRCYDPCLSCATHAIGQMPLEVEVLSNTGDTVTTLRKGVDA